MSADGTNGLEPIGAGPAATALGIALIRGGNQVALKFSLVSFTPLASAAGRMMLGSLALGLWAMGQRDRLLLTQREWPSLVLLAAIFTVQIGILHYGADLTSPAHAVVMMNTNPIWASIFSHFFVPGDRLSARRSGALALAFGGVLLVFLAQPESTLARRPNLGNALLLLSATMVAARTVYLQRLVQTIAPTRAAFWQMLLSVPAFLLAALWTGGIGRPPLRWSALVGMAYQGLVVAGIGFPMWAHLLRRHSPAKLSTFNFLVPFVGLVLSASLMNETIGPRLVAGLLLVSVGIYLAARDGQPRLR